MAKQPGICPSRAALYALSLDTPMRRPHSGMLMNCPSVAMTDSSRGSSGWLVRPDPDAGGPHRYPWVPTGGDERGWLGGRMIWRAPRGRWGVVLEVGEDAPNQEVAVRYFDRTQLDRVLEPRSIAVIGDKASSGFGWLLRFKDFDGALYSVHTNPEFDQCDRGAWRHQSPACHRCAPPT